MTDTITLPRELVKKALEAFDQHRFDALTVAEEREYERHAEALRTAFAAPPSTHPGYIIGSHWLETAYSRICAGEAEEEVLRDCGWRRCAVGQRLTQFCAEAEALRRENERLNAVALQAQNAAIDLTKKNERLREALEVVNSAAELAILHLRVEALRRENERLREALEKIATVNAMDYEYVRWAKTALRREG